MTDARLPGRWLLDPRMDALSDRAWRIWTNVLMYSNEQGTDGLVARSAFRFLHADGVSAEILDELVAVDLIDIVDGGSMQVRNWVGIGQETAERVEQRREANREKSRSYRDRRRKKNPSDVTGDATGDAGGVDEGQEQDMDSDRTGPGSGGQRVNVTPMWTAVQPGSGLRS